MPRTKNVAIKKVKEEVVNDLPVSTPEPVLSSQQDLGMLAGKKVLSIRKITINKKELNEVVLEDLSTQILSDKDLEAQTKFIPF